MPVSRGYSEGRTAESDAQGGKADAHGPESQAQGVPAAFWATPDGSAGRLFLGHAADVLKRLPARSIHCVVTSPPYWGLRDYGTGQWVGGNAECDHRGPSLASQKNTLGGKGQREGHFKVQSFTLPWMGGICGKCGARRIDAQIGTEPSPDCDTGGQAQCGVCFVCSIVGVMREVKRVLRDDGTCWLNLGDTYSSGSSGQNLSAAHGSTVDSTTDEVGGFGHISRPPLKGITPGNLVGVPWRTALALQADGWVLRSDLPWVKRNAMPESVQSRPGKSLEYVFMMTKGDGHYFDMDAVRPQSTGMGGGNYFGRTSDPDGAAASGAQPPRQYGQSGRPPHTDRGFRNSDLWFQSIDTPHGLIGTEYELVGLDVTMRGYSGAHFAVFPPQLISPLILASTSGYGCCAECRRPYERVVSRIGAVKLVGESDANRDRSYRWSRNGVDSTLDSGIAQRETAGWRKACGCQTDKVVPAVVLDPFVGSGTSVSTAIQLGRAGIGIDLSETYLRENVIPRITEALAGPVSKPRKRSEIVLPPSAPTPIQRLRGT